jgi:hypothetical protein
MLELRRIFSWASLGEPNEELSSEDEWLNYMFVRDKNKTISFVILEVLQDLLVLRDEFDLDLHLRHLLPHRLLHRRDLRLYRRDALRDLLRRIDQVLVVDHLVRLVEAALRVRRIEHVRQTYLRRWGTPFSSTIINLISGFAKFCEESPPIFLPSCLEFGFDALVEPPANEGFILEQFHGVGVDLT